MEFPNRQACSGEANDKRIQLTFHARHPDFKTRNKYDFGIRRLLGPLVAHELGHVARVRQGNHGIDLFGRVVHEATAMKLQTTVYPELFLPEVESTEDEINNLEEYLQVEGRNKYDAELLNNWINGKNGLPELALYRIAKSWMDRYTQATGASVEDFFNVETSDFVEAVSR